MALLSRMIIATTAFAVISSQALSQACWEFKPGMVYMYRGPGNMAAAEFGDRSRDAIMKHATKVQKNTAFFMKDGELYSATGMTDPLNEIHQE
jgi:hypothetical protein